MGSGADVDGRREISDSDISVSVIPGTSGSWYNHDRLKKYAPDAAFFNVIGARGVGKTIFGMLMIKEAYDIGMQTIWSRLYESHMDSKFYQGFLDGGKRLGIIPDEWVVDKNGVYPNKMKNPDDIIVIFLSINRAYAHQGNEFANVRYWICDEFTVRAGEQYPNNYPDKVHSLMGTIGRGRDDFSVYFFSNWTTLSNPLWAKMQVYPGKHDVTYFPDKGMAIEVCRNGYYNQDMQSSVTPLGKAMIALGGKIMESEEEDYSFNLILPQRPNGSKPTRFVLYTGSGYFRLWSSSKYSYYDYTSPDPGDYVMVSELTEVGGVHQKIPTQTLQRMRKEIEGNLTRFVDQICLYAVMTFVYSRYQ